MNGIIGRYEKTAQLFDKDSPNIINNKYLKSNGGIDNSGNHCISDYIPIDNTEEYLTISNVPTQSVVYNCFYDDEKNYISGKSFAYDTIPKTVEIPSNAVYIRCSVAKSRLDEFMLNYSENALPYAPYGLVWNDAPYSKLETATDVVTSLPVQLYTDGEPISAYTLKGNTSVSGTPSPSSPVTINGTGNKTANLLNPDSFTLGIWISSTGNKQQNQPYGAISENIPISETSYTVLKHGETTPFSFSFCWYTENDTFILREHFTSTDTSTTITVTPPSNAAYFIYQVANGSGSAYTITIDIIKGYELMLNGGSTALPYEPYGKYKISILKGSQALTPIYLSQPLRKSLDGTAFDTLDSTGLVTYNVDEYGQPQTATTETVTVPTITTTGGTVTLDVDTTIKPSEIDLTYHGWHEHEPLKRENGQWV